jgi:hypothetical protein
MLSIHQIGFWDEMQHQKCKIKGTGTGKQKIIWFKRDENGKLDNKGKFTVAMKRLKLK